MIEFDFTSNIDVALKEVPGFFRDQVPFALVVAMNNTIFATRNQIVNVTYQRAFNVRNARFPGVLWKTQQIGTKGSAAPLRSIKSGGTDSFRVMVKQMPLPSKGGGSPDREYTVRHTTGGTKTAIDGGRVAIPQERNVIRNQGGGVRKSYKPKLLMQKKKVFEGKGKGGTSLILSREKNGETRVMYVLKNSVRIDKRFRFFEDGVQFIERNIGPVFIEQVDRVVAGSRVLTAR